MMLNNKMLFLDLEWQAGLREGDDDEFVLEVGAYFIQPDTKDKEFFYVANPYKPVRNKTYAFLRLSKRTVSLSKTLKSVMKEFKLFAENPDYIVVWSEDTLRMFEKVSKMYGYQFKGRYIVLQPISNAAFGGGNMLAFENTLMALVPDYDPAQMHNALYDAKCLSQLYFILRDYYNSSRNGLRYVSTRSGNKVHLDACRYVRGADVINLTCEDVFANGQLCRKCNHLIPLNADWKAIRNKILDYNRIRRLIYKSVTETQVMEIAELYGVSCRQILDYYEVTTEYSKWHIYYNGKNVTSVYHENYKSDGKGFHAHEHLPKDMFSVIDYIARHEDRTHKKSRISDAEKELLRKEKKKKLQKLRRRMSIEDEE